MTPGFAFFDTPIGRCAIIWRGAFVIGCGLPEVEDESLRASIARRFPDAVEQPPGPAEQAAIGAAVRLLSGEKEDFADVAIDLSSLGEFERAVLAATSAIPLGETRTYGELAEAVGKPGAARAVGRALGSNPVPIIVPCHRVLGSGGKAGGFSAPGGATTKLRILEIERARRGADPGLFDSLPWQARNR
jgi:methylated-DNA-[protein]-cysteine S-methyltransferase